MINKKRFRFRVILPAFPHFNIYSQIAKVTTSLGPICVATAASKLEKWDVEVIDENNCRSHFCPKDEWGFPDHRKLQQERPADVVGFYGSLSSTIPRMYKLAELYKSLGAKTVSGGKHVENLPEEALTHNIDAVVIGDGEMAIRELLQAWEANHPLDPVSGIVFSRGDKFFKTVRRPLLTDFEALPVPNFDLLLYAKMKVFPLWRTRGCNMNCEFCAVKDRTRCDTPEHLLNQIAYLVEHRKARKFFEVSDHFSAHREETIRFCRMLSEYINRVNIRISITVQIRINDAGDAELLQAMKNAGINDLAIGYESPIDEDLKAMRKGYRSRDMITWTDTFHDYGFFIHGMFIFGYPHKVKHLNPISLSEKIRRFREFIRKAKIDTVQILLAVPIPGTELWKRLDGEGRLYPLEEIGWEYYDGQFPLFEPDGDLSPEEIQQAVKQIMKRTYNPWRLGEMIVNSLIHFPRLVFLPALSIITFRVRYISRGFLHWKQHYFRNPSIRFGGYIILKNWMKNFKKDTFLDHLSRARQNLKDKYQTTLSQPSKKKG
jgi:radical SAM superfamily enzyme YgiQ (UPF0313 family)